MQVCPSERVEPIRTEGSDISISRGSDDLGSQQAGEDGLPAGVKDLGHFQELRCRPTPF